WLYAVGKFHLEILDIFESVCARHGTDTQLTTTALNDAAAGVFNVRSDDLGKLTECHPAPCQSFRARLNHKLSFVAAAFVNLGNAGHSSEQGFNRVFVDLAQLE